MQRVTGEHAEGAGPRDVELADEERKKGGLGGRRDLRDGPAAQDRDEDCELGQEQPAAFAITCTTPGFSLSTARSAISMGQCERTDKAITVFSKSCALAAA